MLNYYKDTLANVGLTEYWMELGLKCVTLIKEKIVEC